MNEELHNEEPGIRTPLEELETVFARLQAATEMFQMCGADVGRRKAVRNAVGALSEFVGNIFPHHQELRLPLNQLLYSLYDLDHGQQGTLLKRTTVLNRSKAPLSVRFFRAMAVVLMDLYKPTKKPLEAAAIAAATKLNSLGYKDERGKDVVAKTLNGWRNELKAHSGDPDLGVERYKTVLKELKLKYPNKPDEAAEALLKMLPAMAVRTIVPKPTF
jgi:hypothetical protein